MNHSSYEGSIMVVLSKSVVNGLKEGQKKKEKLGKNQMKKYEIDEECEEEDDDDDDDTKEEVKRKEKEEDE
eukprot:14290473-Ditylum_brightwellii.AAC.1